MLEIIKEMTTIEWIILGCAVVSFLLNFLGLITGKSKKTNILESITESLLEWLPIAVNVAEANGTTGSNKQAYVVRMALNFVKNRLGRKLTDDEDAYFTSFVVKQLEMILSTPQKKENEK